MEQVEKNLKKHLNNPDVPYPDFDQMWDSIRQNKMQSADMELMESNRALPRKRKKVAAVIGLSVALMATPVYAAITYDWGTLLSHKEGIQTALEQGLGQTIEKSVTTNGITMTVHTAFVDENRTFLLYSLDPGESWDGAQVSFDHIGLKDQKGSPIEGNYSHQWNEELGVFQGYFETDWVADRSTSDVVFTIENLVFTGTGKQTIDFDPANPNTQVFQINKDGIDNIKLQSFEQSDGKTMLKSAITFTDPKLQKRSWPRIQAIDKNNEPIVEAEVPISGTPGSNQEYMNQQTFKTDQLLAEDTQFLLLYDRALKTSEGNWNLDLALSKKQMKNGSFKEKLNIPLDQVADGTKINQMTVTPTQVRLVLSHKEKHTRLPYMDYQLDVGGKLLNGGLWFGKSDNETELRFEMTGLSAESLAHQPVSLIAKHRVDEHDGDMNAIALTNISNERQTITSSIQGYPITWTYYMKDHNLYVESLSADPAFGGVNQTYYIDEKDRSYGKPVTVGLLGDGNNKHIDVYENFNKSELEIYIAKYSTEKKDDEMRIPVKQGK